jgi:glycosyltransferase involved in cell wall biosynthesis
LHDFDKGVSQTLTSKVVAVQIQKIKKIAWITSTLHTAGGGSRLLLEGVAYYRSKGIEVLVITWDFDKESLFDGRYARDNIYEIEGSRNTGGSLTERAFKRLKTIKILRRKVREFSPDIIFNQSEYDAALLKIALLGMKYPHVSFVFGQMFQFHEDLAKYAFPFNRHLAEIRNSTPGYRELVPAKRPDSRVRDIFLAQIIAIPRYFAIRASKAIFVFSKQVQWEVSKVYSGAGAYIEKGAYPRASIGTPQHYDIAKFQARPGERILLSLSRLIEKKRVALKIRALKVLVRDRGITDIRLVIGGKGEERENLLNLVKELDLGDYITFLGYVPEAELYPLTSVCDVYLSLDVADFDISPYEALSLRRKIIWSSEMDMDDYLSSCGAIFPVEPEPEAVADAIEAALARDEKTIDWSGLDRYSWETYFENILHRIEGKS